MSRLAPNGTLSANLELPSFETSANSECPVIDVTLVSPDLEITDGNIFPKDFTVSSNYEYSI